MPTSRRRWFKLFVELLEDRSLLTATSALQQAYGQLPLSFEVNEGQTAAQVQYLSHGNGYALFLTSSGAVLSLTGEGEAPAEPGMTGSLPGSRLGGSLALPDTPASAATDSAGVALAMNLVGANPQATVSGLDQQAGVSNYFIGNDPSQWHTNVANYGKVEYQNVYAGINLVYYGNQQQLEYDYQLAPGADPSQIRFAVQGADSLALDAQGNLVLHTAIGDVLEHAPVIYQQIGGVQKPVSGQFVLLGNNEVGFQVGSYDATKPLVIDPVLSYSTYLGGSDGDNGYGIAVDGSGNACVTGYAGSTNFPTSTGAFQASYDGGADAFVTKLNANGTALVYSTFLGGSGESVGHAIAVDGSGDAFVTGQTNSPDFPTTVGAFQATTTASEAGYNSFVTELNASGTALIYSTYLGGTNAVGIALDGCDNAYITGFAYAGLLTTTFGAFQTSIGNSGGGGFITKLNATGTALVYSTYLAANGGYATGIAVGGSGDAYVTGVGTITTTVGAFQTNANGFSDAFVSEINDTGTALVYSTYLGGNSTNDYSEGYAIAVDGSGDAYVTGGTTFSDFPTTAGALQPNYSGDDYGDAFVTKLNASGTGLIYSTYLAGTFGNQSLGGSAGFGIAVDGSGDAYVTGVIGYAIPPTFVDELNAGGTALMYGANLGLYTVAVGIAVDTSGNAYVTGGTEGDLPTTSGAFQTTFGGGDGDYNAFVAKFAAVAPTTTTLTDNGPNPSTYGLAVSFTATVCGGSDTDGETVLIEDASNGNAVVASPTLSGGTVTFNICDLSVGTHDLIAVYNGDDNNGGSDSSATPVAQVVNPTPPPGITSVVINQDISALYAAAGQPSNGVQRSMVDDIVYTFSEPVIILAPGDDPNVFTIAVAWGWTGTVPTLSWAPVAGSGSTEWAVTFSGNGVTGGSIANGAYTITVTDPASITAVSDSQALSLASGVDSANQSFYRLFGDINGDEVVNNADNVRFKQALSTYNAAFDFNADGAVNNADNVRFKLSLSITFVGFTTTI